jgi:hypothetical protein
MQVTGFDFTQRFQRDFKSADPQLQEAVQAALKLLQQNHRSVRAHLLKGHKPKLYSMDVYSNHSWQITFELDGSTAILRRLATHKDIDRAPK